LDVHAWPITLSPVCFSRFSVSFSIPFRARVCPFFFLFYRLLYVPEPPCHCALLRFTKVPTSLHFLATCHTVFLCNAALGPCYFSYVFLPAVPPLLLGVLSFSHCATLLCEPGDRPIFQRGETCLQHLKPWRAFYLFFRTFFF